MPIITISRGSYSKGKEIAEKVAARLGYLCLAREVVLKEAANQHQVPEITLARAIHDAPSILERLGYNKEKYVAYYQAVLLGYLQKDNVVYHGLAGHFFVRGVPHVLKVRILAEIEDRVRWEMEREEISEKEARRILQKDDEERRKWSKSLYGIDTWDAQSYDVVLHMRKISVDNAVDIICQIASYPALKATDESRAKMDDLVVAALVRSSLIDFRPDAEISCDSGVVSVRTTVSLADDDAVVEEIKRIAGAVPGVREVRVSARSSLADV